MIFGRWIPILGGATAFLILPTHGQEPHPIVIERVHPNPESSGLIQVDSRLLVETNRTKVQYGDVALWADQLRFEWENLEATATGTVILQRGNFFFSGEGLRYNFRTGALEGTQFRAGVPPFFVAGASLSYDPTNRVYTAREAFFTTDDSPEPGQRISAGTLRFAPGDFVEARNVTFYAGAAPSLYLPYYARSLKLHETFLTLTPGYRSKFGPFLLGAYHTRWSTNLMTALELDYYQLRGVGVGVEAEVDWAGLAQGKISGYYIHDNEPGPAPDGRPIRAKRYRIDLDQSAQLTEDFGLRLGVHEQSDAQLARDFFETEYRDNPQPRTFLELARTWPNFSLNLLAQPQLNDFFETVQRLPEVKLTAFRQQLGISPFYYEGESSIGYYRTELDAAIGTNDFAGIRADTFHQLVLPRRWFGWLEVTPRIGGRFTRYDSSSGDTRFESANRSVFNTGAEISFQAARLWPEARSTFWDVDGLRHIVEPAINYVYVSKPTQSFRKLPPFDPTLPSLEMLPVDFPDVNALDSIDRQNLLRLSLRNKIQTKRDGAIDDFLLWKLSADGRLDSRQGESAFGDLFSDLEIKPRSSLTLSSGIRYSLATGRLRYANTMASFEPGANWSLAIGHRYFRKDPEFGVDSGQNLLTAGASLRLNENWAARARLRYEAEDGVLEEQQYGLYRDFRSWTAELSFRLLNHRARPTEYGVVLLFSLKAIPRFHLGQDTDRNSMLWGN